MSQLTMVEPNALAPKKTGEKLSQSMLDEIAFIALFSSPGLGIAALEVGVSSVEEAKSLGLLK